MPARFRIGRSKTSNQADATAVRKHQVIEVNSDSAGSVHPFGRRNLRNATLYDRTRGYHRLTIDVDRNRHRSNKLVSYPGGTRGESAAHLNVDHRVGRQCPRSFRVLRLAVAWP